MTYWLVGTAQSFMARRPADIYWLRVWVMDNSHENDKCMTRAEKLEWTREIYTQLHYHVDQKRSAVQHRRYSTKLEMWANAQRDGRPAEYRWRPLFNAAKFGWRPLLECRAVTLPRRETSWNLQGCPKLLNWSQPLIGRSSPYYQDMWRRFCSLTSFFSDCWHML